MKKNVTTLLLAITLFATGAMTATEPQMGIVNFKVCVEKSKQGEQEKIAFDALKKQMSDALEKTDKELGELAKKLEDKDYMESLSPTAEEELKQKFQNLSQEYAQYQSQFYQILNQANYRMLQSLHDEVACASETVRQQKHLSIMLHEDAVFSFDPAFDYTDAVVKEMNDKFQQDATGRQEGTVSLLESTAGMGEELEPTSFEAEGGQSKGEEG